MRTLLLICADSVGNKFGQFVKLCGDLCGNMRYTQVKCAGLCGKNAIYTRQLCFIGLNLKTEQIFYILTIANQKQIVKYLFFC